MTAGGKGKKRTPAKKQILSLSEQTHQEMMEILNFAADNSDIPEIRDAAIDLVKDKSDFLHKQTSRLSPTLTLFACTLVLAFAGLFCWLLYVNQRDIAPPLSVIIIGLALVCVCLLAMFAGQLTQANFIAVVKMFWSRISGKSSQTQGESSTDTITAGAESEPSEGDGA